MVSPRGNFSHSIKRNEPLVVTPDDSELTAAYDGWVSAEVETSRHGTVRFRLTPTFDDATSIEVRAEVTIDGETWDPETVTKASDADGVSSSRVHTLQLVEADNNGEVHFLVVGTDSVHGVRLRAKKTGGSGTATLTASVLRGR